MNDTSTSSSSTAPGTTLVDKDMAEQARPGHGIPSQDPAPAAQIPLSPEEAEREAHSVIVGGGVMVGAATGATVGVAMAGPLGVVVGGAIGGVAGALGGAAAGTIVNPEAPPRATGPAPPDAASPNLDEPDHGERSP